MITAQVYGSDSFVSDDATDNAPARGIQQSAIFDVELLQSVSDSQANNMTRAIHLPPGAEHSSSKMCRLQQRLLSQIACPEEAAAPADN
jgi:hypothetical protein